MPSKGVQAYTYIAVPGVSIELSVPGQTVVRTELHEFWNGDLEVESHNISSFFNKTGEFRFKVLKDGTLVTEQFTEVNALTGRTGGGTLSTIADTPSIIRHDLIVSFGFYAAGEGHDLLPNRHQCYITVSPNYAAWQAQVAPSGSEQEGRPFRRLVLPAAHDIGMNSLDSVRLLLACAGGAVTSKLLGPEHKHQEALGALADKISGPAVAAVAPDIIASLALTQKDALPAVLALGARYFEFRPAHCHRDVRGQNALPDVLYFQHSAIPGMPYAQFLTDVVAFLRANPHEVVVVQLRWDGVPGKCARPSVGEREEYLRTALDAAGGEIVAGSLDDMKCMTIGDLRRERKRLIVLVEVDSLSTYSDEGNATLNGDSIVDDFNRVLNPEEAGRHNFVNIQCQATASNIPKAVVYSVLSADADNSLMLATKGVCDSKTLPWIRDNAIRTCGEENLVLVMNDFFDGATADVAVNLSRQRLG